MDASNLELTPLPAWKRLAIISLFSGAGFALMAALILGGVVWYTSRPTPPKPWNTSVIVAKEPPGFSVSDDSKMIELTYTVENTGTSDYRIDSLSGIEIMARGKDGTLSGPFPDADQRVRLPFFVPTKQKAIFVISLVTPGLPTRDTEESDSDFHERLRKHLEQRFSGMGGITIFDSTNRYRIDLQKWLGEKPKEQTP